MAEERLYYPYYNQGIHNPNLEPDSATTKVKPFYLKYGSSVATSLAIMEEGGLGGKWEVCYITTMMFIHSQS